MASIFKASRYSFAYVKQSLVPLIPRQLLFSAILICCVLLLLTNCASAAPCTPMQVPSIVYSAEQGDYTTFQYSFRYPFKTGIMNEIAIPVNRQLYDAAKNSPHRAVYSGDCTGTQVLEFEIARILDSKQNNAYSAINSELTRLQGQFDQAGLTSGADTFMPVLLAFAASFPDDSDSHSDKFPIETCYEQKGSITDKIWLLLGLMQNKGYRVVLVDYGSSVIPAVYGTSCNGKDGYLFIDMIEQTIGKRPKGYAVVDPIAILPVGTGTKQYQPETCVPDGDILSKLRASLTPNLEVAKPETEDGLLQAKGDEIHGYTQYMNEGGGTTISALIQEIQNGKEESWIWNNLGVIYTEQNRFEEAEAAFNRALEMDPTSVEVLVNMAYLFGNQQNKFELAETYINQALSFAPEDPLAWYERGMLYYLTGNAINAADAFQQALQCDETMTEAQAALDILSRISTST